MPETVQSISQREVYQPDAFTRFLWWLATAEKELLVDCVIDRNRYAITGMTVLGTWLFATLAWTYFFFTVVGSFWLALPVGIFMGGIILGIDRALIKGISPANKTKLLPLAFRGLLALTIGTFMAQPALLYLFDKEIHVQISLDNEQKKRDKLQQQDSLYAKSKNELLQQKGTLQQQLNLRYNEVTEARNAFIAETDGTGGSKKIGLKEIAQAKQQAYEKLNADYLQTNAVNQVKLNTIDSSLAAIEAGKQKEQAVFTELLNDGFLTRTEALQHLIKSNSAAQFRYYLLVVILVLIELMPVIAKTLLPSGAYDEKIKLREQMEKTMAANNQQKEQELKELYNRLAFEQDSGFIKQFFDEAQVQRQEKMKAQYEDWKNTDNSNFDDFWERIKKDMLTKQEN